jgi:hypothetical protein
VPLALAETDLLDEFITDAYSAPLLRATSRWLPRRFEELANFRYEAALPADRVRCLWGTTVTEHVRHQLGFCRSVTFAKLDGRFSLAAAARARQTESNLLLYSTYAWEAFTAQYRHTPRKVLFQFHPHPDVERRILLEDLQKYQFVRRSFQEEIGERVAPELRRRNRECWRYADLIISASSFTERSLLEAGASPNLCKIVPYGIDAPEDAVDRVGPDEFHALFVGAGSQRKGLHHLLLAWQRAALPPGSRLTLVCRVIDPGIEALIEQRANVRLIRGLGDSELKKLFGKSSLLVMPSLVEGFGNVYLEAMARGCPVLGTRNTCLPDLRAGVGAIFQVEVGQIDQLVAELERLSRSLPGDASVRARARSCATGRSWPQFRAEIRAALTPPGRRCSAGNVSN